MTNSSSVICRSCGAHGTVVRHRAGSVALEVLLWLALVTPGFIYHMWRHRRNYWLCQECGSTARTWSGIARRHGAM